MSKQGVVLVHVASEGPDVCLGRRNRPLSAGAALLRYVTPEGRIHKRERLLGFTQRAFRRRTVVDAATAALKCLVRPCAVTLYSDSPYLVSGDDLLGRWVANGWRRADGRPLANRASWEELHKMLQKHRVCFVYADPCVDENLARVQKAATQRLEDAQYCADDAGDDGMFLAYYGLERPPGP